PTGYMTIHAPQTCMRNPINPGPISADRKPERNHMATFAPVRATFAPPVPQNFTDLGVPDALVMDLMLRRMVIEGHTTLANLSRALKIAVPLVDTVFKHMRQQQLVEIKGMMGNDYQFTLSGAGKQLASERFQVSQYAGVCPVSLKEYLAATKAQS